MSADVTTERKTLENWFTSFSAMPNTGYPVRTVEDAALHVWAALRYRVVFNTEGRGYCAGNSGYTTFWIDPSEQPGLFS